MSDRTGPHRQSMPARIKGVLAVVCLQAVLGGISSYALYVVIQDDIDHGTANNEGVLLAFVYFSFLLAAVLAVCAFLITRRYRWVRAVVIGIQALGILSGVLNLVTGAFAALIGIAVGIAVIMSLSHDEAKAWFVR